MVVGTCPYVANSDSRAEQKTVSGRYNLEPLEEHRWYTLVPLGVHSLHLLPPTLRYPVLSHRLLNDTSCSVQTSTNRVTAYNNLSVNPRRIFVLPHIPLPPRHLLNQRRRVQLLPI